MKKVARRVIGKDDCQLYKHKDGYRLVLADLDLFRRLERILVPGQKCAELIQGSVFSIIYMVKDHAVEVSGNVCGAGDVVNVVITGREGIAILSLAIVIRLNLLLKRVETHHLLRFRVPFMGAADFETFKALRLNPEEQSDLLILGFLLKKGVYAEGTSRESIDELLTQFDCWRTSNK